MRIASACASLFLALCLTATAAAQVAYVDQNAPGPGHDGAAWDTAFLTIQEGVDAATPGGEVWVADGTYVENVVMGSGVAIYGGFLGAEEGGYETEREQRDFTNNIATIDGNQSGSCVVMAVDARVDGFSVTNGSGYDGFEGVMCGGGFYCTGTGPTGIIANNTVVGNKVGGYGGGIYCCGDSSPTIMNNFITGGDSFEGGGISCVQGAAPTIANNVVSNNEGYYGGGIGCRHSSSPVVLCNVVVNNWVHAGGGGIVCSFNSTPLVLCNTIMGNYATYDGGGMWCTGGCGLTAANNVIAGNVCDGYGGGVGIAGSDLMMANNVIVGNTASRGDPYWGGFGGGVYSLNASPTIANNIVTENSADVSGGGILCEQGGSPALSHNDFWANSPNNYDGCEPGEGDISADPLFVDPENGDYHLSAESPCIDAGCNDYVFTDEDIDGDPRIIWAMRFPVFYWPHPGYVDMGADEFVPRARMLTQQKSGGVREGRRGQ